MTSQNAQRTLESPSLRANVVNAFQWQLFGQVGGQGFRIAANLILTRILAPDAFGLMGMVQVYITSVQLFSDVGLRESVIHHEDGEKPEFLNTIWTLQIARGILLWLFTVLGAYPFAIFFDMPELVWLLPIAGFSMVMLGFASTDLLSAGRNINVRKIVIVELTSLFLGSLVTVILAWFTESVIALSFGWIANHTAYAAFSHLQRTRTDRIGWNRDAARSIINFGRISIFGSGLMIIQQRADRIVLAKIISLGSLGAYVIGSNLAAIPMILFAQVSRRILHPVYSKLQNDELASARTRIRKLRCAMVYSHAVIFSVLILFGQWIVDFLYPTELSEAGWYCSILALGALIRVATDPGPVFPARGDAKTHLVITVARSIALILSMSLGWAIGGYYGDVANGVVLGFCCGPLLSYPYESYRCKRVGVWLPEVDLPAICLCGVFAVWLATSSIA